MVENQWRKFYQTFIFILALAPIVLFFQNCGESFSPTKTGALSSTTDPGGTNNPPPTPVDPNAPLQVFARDTAAQQGAEMVFRIETNRAHTDPIVVNLQTTDGTARAPNDYDTFTGSVTIPVGQTFAEAKIQSRAFIPASIEKQTQMQLQIISTSAGAIGDNSAVGTIRGTVRAMKFKYVYASASPNYADTYNCGVGMDDLVYCWGLSGARTGHITSNLTPLPHTVIGPVLKMVSSHAHSCAINTQNKVYCWGRLSNVGLPSAPIEVPEFANSIDIDLAGQYTLDNISCAVNSMGQVNCIDAYNRRLFNIPFPTPIKQISIQGNAGYYIICGINPNNTVTCAPLNNVTSLGNNPQFTFIDNSAFGLFKRIDAGTYNTCGILMNDTLACWSGNTLAANTPIVQNIKELSVGVSYTCIINNLDEISCWGSNRHGQLGQGNTLQSSSTVPLKVIGLNGAKNLRAASTACAINQNNEALCWGNSGSTISRQGTLPRALATIFDKENYFRYSKIIAADAYQEIGVTIDNLFHEPSTTLGTIESTTIASAPYAVTGLDRTTGVVAFGRFNCFLSNQKDIRCWGVDFNNVTIAPTAPVTLPGSANIKNLLGSIGSPLSICAIDQNDIIQCWASLNSLPTPYSAGTGTRVLAYADKCDTTSGCLILTTTGQVLRPPSTFSAGQVTNFANAKAISGSTTHWCVLYTNGSVACQGNNNFGQLGNNSTVNSGTLVDVIGINNAVQISSARDHNCALLQTGKVMCWGAGRFGQLGNNTFANALVPTEVQNISNVQSVLATAYQTIFQMQDGSLRGVGLMDYEALSPNLVGAIPN